MKKSIAFLFFISTMVYWRWFFFQDIFTHGDWGFFFKATQNELFTLPHIWENTGIGSIAISSITSFPINLLWGLLSKEQSFAMSEKIIYFIPIVGFSTFGSWILIRSLTKSNIGAILGSLVFIYNSYFLIGQTGHLTLMAAFAISPLALLFFIKTIEEKSLKQSLITGLLFFVMSFYEIRAFYIFAWICFFYFLLHTFLVNKFEWRNMRNIIISSIFALIPMLIVVILNCYWILGLSSLGLIANNEIFSRDLFGNSFMNIIQSFTLFHPFWTGGAYYSFVVQPIPNYFSLIPIFAFFGLFLKRKDIVILFFGFISLLGILLSKQVSSPFTTLYAWLYSHLPGFNAFREASKFYYIIALGYSVLIGSFVDYIWQKLNKNSSQKYLKYTLTLLIAGIFLWNTKPLITGEIGTLFVPRHIPNDYVILKDYILKQPDFFRTLWFPTDSRWSIYTGSHPKVSVVATIESSWLEFNRGNEIGLTEQKRITKIINNSLSNQLFDNSSIKYVIVPIQDISNDDDFFKYYGNRKNFIEVLNNVPYLHKISINTKELVVYENYKYRPHIYTTQQNESILNEVSYTQASSIFKNPTEYTISLKKVMEPRYINFSETFHPDWKMRVGEFNWFKVLVEKNYFIADKYHTESDAKLNSFYINPAIMCKSYTCKKNTDGSYDMNLTVYFRPQSYMYFGLIISGSTLAACLTYLAYSGIKKLKKKKNDET